MEPQPLPGWTLRAHRSPVRTLGFGPDGLTCSSGDDEGWVVWWSLETRRPLAIWHAHETALLTTEFWSPDELLTHGRDNKLRIWRLSRAETYNTQPLSLDAPESSPAPPPAHQNTGSANPVNAGTGKGSSPHSHSILHPSAAGGGPSTHYPKPWLVHAMDVNALNFCPAGLSPASSQFAVPATTASERIDVYKLGHGLELSRPHKALNGADVLPLQTVLSDEAAQTKRRGELGTVMALLFFDTETLLAGYESGHIVVFDLKSGSPLWTVRPHRVPVLSLAAHNNTVWSTAADKTIAATDMLTSSTQPAARLAHKGVAAIDVLHDKNIAVAACWNGTIAVFSIEGPTDLRELATFKGGRHAGLTCARVKSAQVSPSKRRLKPLPPAWIVAGGKDGRVGLFGVPSDFTRDTLQRSAGPVPDSDSA